jgi:hypothetical protein
MDIENGASMKTARKSVLIGAVMVALVAAIVVVWRSATTCRVPSNHAAMVDKVRADPLFAIAAKEGPLADEWAVFDTCIQFSGEWIPPNVEVRRHYATPSEYGLYTIQKLHNLFDQPAAAAGWAGTHSSLDSSTIEYCGHREGSMYMATVGRTFTSGSPEHSPTPSIEVYIWFVGDPASASSTRARSTHRSLRVCSCSRVGHPCRQECVQTLDGCWRVRGRRRERSAEEAEASEVEERERVNVLRSVVKSDPPAEMPAAREEDADTVDL